MRLDDKALFSLGFTVERRLKRESRSIVFLSSVTCRAAGFPIGGSALPIQWFVAARENKVGQTGSVRRRLTGAARNR